MRTFTDRRMMVFRVVALALMAGATGCADVMTYSKDARRAGLTQYEEGNYADAAGAFRNAVRQNPRDYKSHFYLGQSYERMGQHQQAIHAYKASLDTQRVTQEGRENVEFRVSTMDALARVIAAGDQRDLETNRAEQAARSTQTSEPFFQLAKIYRHRGDADNAIEAYNRAMLLDARNPFVAKEYGLYLLELGQPQRAETPLRKAYALNPADAEVDAALRRIGVVPGPSLRPADQLAKPPLPKGPIPPLHLGIGRGSNQGSGSAAPAQPASPQTTVQTPRD